MAAKRAVRDTTSSKPLPRAPVPTYSSRVRLPAPLDDIASGMKQLADLGQGAISRIGERLRTIRKSI